MTYTFVFNCISRLTSDVEAATLGEAFKNLQDADTATDEPQEQRLLEVYVDGELIARDEWDDQYVGEYDRVQTVLVRNSDEERVFAIVSCRKTDAILDGGQIRQPLRSAVKAWAAPSSMEFNCGFNIADCADELADEKSALHQCLQDAGVHDLDIQIYAGLPSAWSFDTSLL